MNLIRLWHLLQKRRKKDAICFVDEVSDPDKKSGMMLQGTNAGKRNILIKNLFLILTC